MRVREAADTWGSARKSNVRASVWPPVKSRLRRRRAGPAAFCRDRRWLLSQIPSATMSTLDAAYGVLPLDRDFYAAIATAPRRLIASVLVPIRTGRAWKVPSGCIVRISTSEGPQVGDLSESCYYSPAASSAPSRTSAAELRGVAAGYGRRVATSSVVRLGVAGY